MTDPDEDLEDLKEKVALKRAIGLLKTFRECMPLCEGIIETVRKWEDRVPPPLMRSSPTWRDAMKGNREKLEQFEGLVYFLTEAIFGVDCDGDSVISTSFIDKSRYLHRHPPFRVPRLPDKPTFKQIMEARELAQTNVASAQEVLRVIEVDLKFFMEDNKDLFPDGSSG